MILEKNKFRATDLQNFWNINSYDNSFLPEKSAIYGQCSNDEIAQATQ